ncbi:MAG: Gfo/Idh/MocA family protein [Armatimonadota bacterium]
MRINSRGQLIDEKEIRAGFIGCGSHSFRNIYPTFQFAPVKLTATCDLIEEKAEMFAAKFGAERSYTSYHKMLEEEDIDAVFVVTGYDSKGRPLYPAIAEDCLRAGCHVWIEKPPAASSVEIERLMQVSQETGKHVLVGLKKMFFPANEKAKELTDSPEFGNTSLVLLQYPQYIPTVDEITSYMQGNNVTSVLGFLDHLCHPAALMVYLLGMPSTLHYERSACGGGVASFTFPSGAVASLALTHGASINGGMERTMICSDRGNHIVVDNNVRVSYHKSIAPAYGASPTFYPSGLDNAISSWEPEFSLGQLYNKGLFLLGYYGEVNEFARSILENRPPSKGTLEQAHQVTRIFEAFVHGPGKMITL